MENNSQFSTLNSQLLNRKAILLVEDNPKINKLNRETLDLFGYRVLEAESIEAGRSIILQESPDLLVLDIMLPDGDGRSLGRELQQDIGRKIPTLYLSGLTEEADVLSGYDSGGDDYLTKPYSIELFMKKVEALLRLSDSIPSAVTKGALTLRYNSGQAFVNGEDILLGKKEFSLLNVFVQSEGKLLNEDFIYGEVWGRPMEGNKKALKTAISSLRNKLKESGCEIDNEKGEGYRFRIMGG